MNESLSLSRLLVGLSLFRLEDRSTLRFVSDLVHVLKVDRVDFLHVLDADADDEPGGRIAEARRRMSELVSSTFEADGATTELLVATGSPLRKLLDAARTNEADLVVVGRKVNHQAVLPDMLARKAPCSVLVVPEGVVTTIRRILVPVDFSPHSQAALRFAVTLARRIPGSSITCHHAFHVPIGYSKMGRSFEEFAAQMRKNAEGRYKKMVTEVGTSDTEVSLDLEASSDPSASIAETVRREGYDLVVMGARGLSGPAAFLLGSVTEKAMKSVPVPLIAVKEKGEGLSFLEAFLEE